LCGRVQIFSQRPLAPWQRRLITPVAPRWDQRIPDSFSRWPMTGLAPGFDGVGADEHAKFAEPGVAHPVALLSK